MRFRTRAANVAAVVVASVANVVKAVVISAANVVKVVVVMVVASAASVVKAVHPRRDDSTGRRRFGGDA